jgi:hypothetical protein
LAGSSVEFSRFDDCHLVAEQVVDGENDASAFAALSAPPLPATTLSRQVGVTAKERRLNWRPVVLTATGLAIAAVGAGLVGSVQGDYARLSNACATGDCAPTTYQPFKVRENVGWGVIAAGGALAVAGAIWAIIKPRRQIKVERASRPLACGTVLYF